MSTLPRACPECMRTDRHSMSCGLGTIMAREPQDLQPAPDYRAFAAEAVEVLKVFVSGQREGWWGTGSGEMEEGELQLAEDLIARASSMGL